MQIVVPPMTVDVSVDVLVNGIMLHLFQGCLLSGPDKKVFFRPLDKLTANDDSKDEYLIPGDPRYKLLAALGEIRNWYSQKAEDIALQASEDPRPSETNTSQPLSNVTAFPGLKK